MNLATILPRQAKYRKDHPAVIFENHRFTYSQYNTRVNQLANGLLAQGIGQGSHIATLLPNCLELLDLYWAVAKIGAVIIPMSPLLRGKGLTTLINDSDASCLFVHATLTSHIDAIRPDIPRVTHFYSVEGDTSRYETISQLVSHNDTSNPTGISINADDPYNIFYSSGTTGLPKGIVHTHKIRTLYALLFGSGYRMRPESVVLHTGALIFNGAFLTMPQAFHLGATYIFHRNFSASALIATVAQEHVTHIKMVPSQIVAMLNAPTFDPAIMQSLEMVGSVGAPLHMEHKLRLEDALPSRFYELYGLTEGFMTILEPLDFAEKSGSVGCPGPFTEIRVVDPAGNDLPAGEVGEIIGRGPLLMPTYYKRPDLTVQAIRDGWLWSGDLGYLDEDGFLYLVDRSKDMIISGGVNVYPRDIEEIVVQHPAVHEAAVFGIPDEKWGETPIAAILLKPNSDVSESEIMKWVNERVEARYQKLSAVRFYDQFPRSAAGKTLKRIMREPFWDDSDTQI